MFPEKNIEDELSSISTVLKCGINGNLYNVPEEYFETLPLNVLKNTSSPIKMEVPKDYFTSLADAILKKVGSEKAKNNFEDLNNYTALISKRILEQNSAKVKTVRIIPVKPFYRYAVAAVITGLVGLGIFTNLYKTNSNELFKSEVYTSALNIIDNNNFDEILSSIDAEDATAYLTAYGQDVNSALVALSAEDYTMDSPEELFFNENELDHFLQVNDLQSTN